MYKVSAWLQRTRIAVEF